jgi:hypothetical protein
VVSGCPQPPEAPADRQDEQREGDQRPDRNTLAGGRRSQRDGRLVAPGSGHASGGRGSAQQRGEPVGAVRLQDRGVVQGEQVGVGIQALLHLLDDARSFVPAELSRLALVEPVVVGVAGEGVGDADRAADRPGATGLDGQQEIRVGIENPAAEEHVVPAGGDPSALFGVRQELRLQLDPDRRQPAGEIRGALLIVRPAGGHQQIEREPALPVGHQPDAIRAPPVSRAVQDPVGRRRVEAADRGRRRLPPPGHERRRQIPDAGRAVPVQHSLDQDLPVDRPVDRLPYPDVAQGGMTVPDRGAIGPGRTGVEAELGET